MVVKPRRQHLTVAPNVRNLKESDVEALGRLLFDAYRDTVDDEGESLEDAITEARKTIDGEYGELNWEACFVVESKTGLSCACIVSEFEGAPLLAFCATEKAAQRRGLATDLTRCSLDVLAGQGRTSLRLIVTSANAPAVQLYRKLGFAVEVRP